MDGHAFLRSRRSVRRFKAQPVDAETLDRILETGLYAPSAHHRQPWRFAVLTSPEVKSRLSEAMAADFKRDLARDGLGEAEIAAQVTRSKNRIVNAPVVIILCMDESEMDRYPDETRAALETTMAVQSTALAGMQLLLAAHAEGLGAVWVCAPLFAAETVRKTLDLPQTWQPQAMIFIGYAADKPKKKVVKEKSEVVRFIDDGR